MDLKLEVITVNKMEPSCLPECFYTVVLERIKLLRKVAENKDES